MHHGRTLNNRIFRLKKDFVSFTIKSIHPFEVSLIETDLCVSKLAISKFLLVKFSSDMRRIAPIYLLIS